MSFEPGHLRYTCQVENVPPVARALTSIKAPVARYHVGFSRVRTIRNDVHSVGEAMRPGIVGLDTGASGQALLRAKHEAVVAHGASVIEKRNHSLPDRIVGPGQIQYAAELRVVLSATLSDRQSPAGRGSTGRKRADDLGRIALVLYPDVRCRAAQVRRRYQPILAKLPLNAQIPSRGLRPIHVVGRAGVVAVICEPAAIY